MRLDYSAAKRKENLRKHGLDFVDAPVVLESRYRLDVPVVRKGEARIQSLAYVFEVLTVLSVAHVEKGDVARIISFRHASVLEREVYHEWLENDFKD